MNFWGWSAASIAGAGASGAGAYYTGYNYGTAHAPNKNKTELEQLKQDNETKDKTIKEKEDQINKQNEQLKAKDQTISTQASKITGLRNDGAQVLRMVDLINQTARSPWNCNWNDWTKWTSFKKTHPFKFEGQTKNVNYLEFGCLDSTKKNVTGAFSH